MDSLWLPLGALSLPWAVIWVPFGCLGAPWGIQWDSLDRPLENPWKLAVWRGPKVDFLIDVRSGIIGLEFIRGIPGIPGIRGIRGIGVINCSSGPPYHTRRGSG